MAKTTLSAIGGVIQGNWNDEWFVGAHADGTAKPGDCVTVESDGQVEQTDIDGSQDEMLGIMLPHHGTDMDTAPAAGKPVSIVIVQSGHLYGVHIDTDQGTEIGEPMVYHASTGGILDEGGNLEAEHVARKFRGAASDTYAVVVWGA